MGLRSYRTVATSHPFRGVTATNGFELHGYYADRKTRWQIDVKDFTHDMPLEAFPPCRQPNSYPHRANYEGLYVVESTGQQVWFESFVERSVLMQLDHEGDLQAIASQPFCIVGDQWWHYPDYVALLKDGTRVVIDVRPRKRMSPGAIAQFKVTSDVMAAIGVGYQVRHGPKGTVGQNLEWLAQFRHRDYALPADAAARMDRCARNPIAISQLASELLPEQTPRAYAGVYQALWHRVLVLDAPGLLGPNSKVRTKRPGEK